MNRYLFLDIDGVLNSHQFFYSDLAQKERLMDRSIEHQLDPAAIGHLNAIIQATDAQIVISSSWRIVRTVSVIKHALHNRGLEGDKVIGKTGYRSDGDSSNRRGLEIQDWLNEKAGDAPHRFVILDDSSDMGELRHAFLS